MVEMKEWSGSSKAVLYCGVCRLLFPLNEVFVVVVVVE